MSHRCAGGRHPTARPHRIAADRPRESMTGWCAYRGGLSLDPDAACRHHWLLLTGWLRTDTEWSRERGRR